MSFTDRRIQFTTRLLLLMAILPLAVCKGSEKPSCSVFASADEAGSALLAAVKSRDQNALMEIFGPDSKEILLRRCRAGRTYR